MIRLVPEVHKDFAGNDSPYFEYVEHWHNGVKRTFICSRKWKEDDDLELVPTSGKCVACYDREENDNKRQISFRRLNAFLLLHLDWYYLIPATDKDGKILTREKDGKFYKKGDPIMNRVLEEDAVEDLGKRKIQREGYERVFGKLMHWSMGTNHLLALSAKMMDLRKHCHCGGKIEEVVWECRGCDAEILDLTPESRDKLDMTKKEISDMTSRPYKCDCGHEDLLRPVLECDNCPNPKPLQLWDVNLEVSREGEGTQSIVVIHSFDTDELDDEVWDLVPDPDRPILHRVFAGDSLEHQLKHMRVKNPFGDDRQHVQDYGEPADGEPADDLDDLPF